MTTIKEMAANVVEAAGTAGGIDEVRRLADRGWPVSCDLEIATLSARKYEDHDDSLAAAASDVAGELGLERWMVDAHWADDDRETIVVTTDAGRAPAVAAAIQVEAARVIAESAPVALTVSSLERLTKAVRVAWHLGHGVGYAEGRLAADDERTPCQVNERSNAVCSLGTRGCSLYHGR